MASRLSDYGGNKPTFRHRRSNFGDNKGAVSMRCLDCDKLRYVTPQETNRAARPRCLDCAGPLEEIDVSRGRRGLPKKAKLAIEAVKKPIPRCKGCGGRIGDFLLAIPPDNLSQSLSFHLSTSSDCRRYYVDSKYLRKIVGYEVIAGTEHVVYGQPFNVVACLPDGSERVVIRNRTKRECLLEIKGESNE